MKSEQIQEYEETEGILFYQGRIDPENQLRTQDLEGCKFFNFMEIGYDFVKILNDDESHRYLSGTNSNFIHIIPIEYRISKSYTNSMDKFIHAHECTAGI